MSELKPCPFCGCKDIEIRDLKLGIYAICRRCGASIRFSHSIVDAIAAWNRRTIDRDELIMIADSLDDSWAQFPDDTIMCEEVDTYEQEIAARIRKAVGA